jgi:2-polyprenyl-6-methoxyphenol hydroxylase-like FAD-dependent oxidoreductase
MIGRRPLRVVLARGLENNIRWGTPVSDWTPSPTGVVLADGTEVDLLVAADGTGSRTAQRWAGQTTARRSGVIGIAGRSPATAADSRRPAARSRVRHRALRCRRLPQPAR